MGPLKKYSRRFCFRRGIVYVLTWCMFFHTSLPLALAGPEGAQVVNGQVSFQQSGNNTTITASDKSIINYSRFDIAQPEVVRFVQPGSSAAVLNRILSANPTSIYGTLLANGRVFFVNPAGVYIGSGARINVNQLVASGLNMSDSDFINGRYNFVGGNGSVINNGDISAESVYLIGKQVANSGNISCPAGYVVMTAGDRVFLGEPGSDVVVEIASPVSSEPADPVDSAPGVLNEGTVDVAGGMIVLAAAGDIYSQAISNVGTLSASVDAGQAGEVKLVATEGTVLNSGTIKATSNDGKGGTVEVLGDRVGLVDAAEIDASGSDGGGTVLVGGDYQGSGDVPTASRTYVSTDSSIKADATANGDGGEVIVWADEVTRFYGDISARGGTEGGDGGFVEVSGQGNLGFYGHVDTQALVGDNGTLLLDPTDLTITDTAAGQNLDAGFTGTIEFGDGLNDGTDSVSAGVLEDLAGGTDIILKATNKITIDPLTSAGKGGVDKELTLDQTGDVKFLTGAGGFSMAADNTINVTGAANLTIDAVGATSGGTGDGPVVLGELQTASGDITVHGTAVTVNGAINSGGSLSVNGSSVNLYADLAAAGSMSGDNTAINVGWLDGISHGSIQDAIDISKDGATVADNLTITVQPGGYEEDLVIPATKTNLELAGADKSTTTIKGVANVDSGLWPLAAPNIEILGDGTKIHDFTIEGPDPLSGWYASGMVIGGLNVEVYDNRFLVPNAGNLDDISQGIQTYHATANPAGTDLGGLNIYNNEFSSLGDGTAGYEAIYINRASSDPTPPQAVTIADNTFGGALFRGITTERSNVDISGNTLTTTLPAGDTWQGILVRDYALGDQRDVTITNNTVQGFSQGIRIGSTGQTLTNITIENSIITDNTVGVQVRASADNVKINRNDISSNTSYGVENLDAGTVAAAANWWGDATGPLDNSDDTATGGLYNPMGQGSQVTDNVDYNPWFAKGGDSSTDPGFQPESPMDWGMLGIDGGSPQSWIDNYAGSGDRLNLSYSGDITLAAIDDTALGDPGVNLNIATLDGQLTVDDKIDVGGWVKIGTDETVGDDAATNTNLTVNGAIDPTSIYLFSDDDIAINAALQADDSVLVEAGLDGTGGISSAAAGDIKTTNSGDQTYVTLTAGTEGGASGGIALDGTVTTSGGNVTLNAHHGAVTVGDEINTSGAAGGAIDISGTSVNLNGRIRTADGEVSVTAKTGNIGLADFTSGGSAERVNIISGDGGVTLDASAGNITVADDTAEAEIETTGSVSLTGAAIGATNALGVDGASALEITDTGAGNIQVEELVGTSITSTTITVGNTGYGTIDIAYHNGDQAQIGDNHALTNVDLDQGQSEFSYTATAGDITVGAVKTAAKDVTLTASEGAIRDAANDSASPLVDITAGTINLTAASGGIGTPVGEDRVLEVTAATALNADTDAGDDGDILIGSIGDLRVGLVDAGSGTVVLRSTAAIVESSTADPEADVGGGNVALLTNTDVTGTDGGIGTDAEALDVTAATWLYASTTTDDSDIYVDSLGDLPIFWIGAGAGDVTLNSTGAINDAADDMAVDIAGTTVTLTAQGEIGGGIATKNIDNRGALEVTSGSLDVSVVTAGNIVLTESDGTALTDVDTVNGSIDIVSTTGDLVVGDVDATGTVTLEATAGSINDATDDPTVDIQGTTVTLTARDEIGGGIATKDIDNRGALEVTSGSLDVSVVTAGNIVLTESDGTALTDVDTVNGSIDIVSTTGDLTVGDIDATGTVMLEATTGSISEGADDPDADISAATLELIAHLGITGSSPIETSATNITASTDQGDIDIDNDSGSAVSGSLAVTTGAGNILFSQAGGGDLEVAASTVNGNIDIDATANITLDSLTALGHQITVSADGAIDDAQDDASTDLAADTLVLTANDGIGAGIGPDKGDLSDPIETEASVIIARTIDPAESMADIVIDNHSVDPTALTASTVGTDSYIYFDQTGGGELTLTDVSTADGEIRISAEQGNLVASQVNAGGLYDSWLGTTTSGDVIVDNVSADNVLTIESAGAISEVADAPEAVDITAAVLELIAHLGITGGSPIETSASNITASTDEGDIDIDNDNALATTASLSVTSGAGNILFNQRGGGDLEVAGSTANGNIDIDATANVTIDSLAAAGHQITVSAYGGINDDADDTDVDITADVLTLIANNEIGGNPPAGNTTDTFGAIETDVTSLEAHSNSSGDIVIAETGAITLTDVDTFSGNILVSAGGLMTATDVEAGGAGNVGLTTTNNGNVVVDKIAAGNMIGIDSDGSISEVAEAPEAVDLSAATLYLLADTGIAGSSAIETSSTEIWASTYAGDIDIDNDNASATTASLEVTDGAGNILFSQAGGGSLTATGDTEDGDIGIDVTNANLLAGVIAAGDTGSVTLQALQGNMSGGPISAYGGSVTMTQRDSLDTGAFTFGNEASTDISLTSNNGSITSNTADSWKSITAAAQSAITLDGSGNISTKALTSASGNIDVDSAAGGITASGDIATGNGKVILTAAGDVTTKAVTSTNGGITIQSGGGSVTANDSLTANSGNVALTGAGDVTMQSAAATNGNIEIWSKGGSLIINEALTAENGGVSLIADGGRISTGAGDTLDVAISGYSDGSKGVALPEGSGLAAIVIKSRDSLSLGPQAILTANGEYDATVVHDDRPGAKFFADGDPIDIAIYLAGLGTDSTASDVEVASQTITINNDNPKGVGTLVVDAGYKVRFADGFEASLKRDGASNVQRIEAVSRKATTLDFAILHDTLPHADDPSRLANGQFVLPSADRPTGGVYVLRGTDSGSILAEARVLGLSSPVPLATPKPFEPDIRSEVESLDETELMAWLAAEFNEPDIQMYMAAAYPSLLSTDLRPYKAAERLRDLATILKGDVQITALRAVVAESWPVDQPLDEVAAAAIAQSLSTRAGEDTLYALAGQWINALTEYVGILNTEIGKSTDESITFVVRKYGSRLVQGADMRTSMFIEMHLERTFGT
ncbi:MAG TPA: filamentous hemagglutinin N-terminal domain-containing protein [Sedimentisphaerales bacterium]|nr:filamentous hemagglutinin N-terminal domain-containing protein [Sedimentisphaerales bacterium]